jgi:hypothetical protein
MAHVADAHDCILDTACHENQQQADAQTSSSDWQGSELSLPMAPIHVQTLTGTTAVSHAEQTWSQRGRLLVAIDACMDKQAIFASQYEFIPGAAEGSQSVVQYARRCEQRLRHRESLAVCHHSATLQTQQKVACI